MFINPPVFQFLITVSRLFCRSENYEMDLILDVNTALYPIDFGNKITFVLANSLYEDGTIDDGSEFDQSNKPSLADKYEYVMYGKVYRCDEEDGDKIAVYVSFGGLLMRLKGDARNLMGVDIDNRLYLLLRKN